MVQALWLSMTCVFVWDVAYLQKPTTPEAAAAAAMVEDATSDIWSTRSWYVDLSSIQLVLGHHWSKLSEAGDRDDLQDVESTVCDMLSGIDHQYDSTGTVNPS